MVWIFGTYKCTLARLTKSVQAAVLKNGQHKRTIISCMVIFSLQWKQKNNRFICNMHKTSSYTFRLWGTTTLRSIQKHTPYRIILGTISYRWFKASSRNSKKNTNKRKDRKLAGQSSSIPFMSIKDSYNKKVTFDTWDQLEEKIDKLTDMMGKLAARDNGTNR